MYRSSIFQLRARLVLLIIVAAIPISGLSLYNGLRERETAVASVQTNALQVARLAALNQGRLIEETRQLLTILSGLAQVRSENPEACSTLLADLLDQFPTYTNIGVIAPDGSVLCSALSYDPSVNLADRTYFQRVLQTKRFAVGDFQIGRISGEPSLNFGYPVLDAQGDILAVAFAGLDLSWLGQVFAKAELPSGSTITAIDHSGTVLARFPAPDNWVGQSVPDEPLVQAILGQVEGTANVEGLDGVRRLYGFTRVAEALEHNQIYVGVGIPQQAAFAQINAALTQNLFGLGAVFALTLAAAWFGSGLVVLRPLKRLMEATTRLRGGDLGARTRLSGGPSELHQLARAFDEMAGALEKREVERRQAQDALEGYNRRLRILNAIDRLILAMRPGEAVTQLAVNYFFEQMAIPGVSIVAFDYERKEGIVLTAQEKNGESSSLESRFDLKAWSDDDLAHLRTGASQRIEIAAVPIQLPPGLQVLQGFRVSLRIPLIAADELIGVLNLAADDSAVFTPELEEIAREISDQVAIALQQSRLHERIRRHAAELEQRVVERTAQLVRAKEQVETILNSTGDAIVLIDGGGMIQQANQPCCALLDRAEDELSGQALSSVATPGETDRVTGTLRAVVDDKRPQQVELVMQRRDGTSFDAELTLAPVIQHNELHGIVASFRDITQRKRFEESLQKALDKEREINELKSRFTSMLSHEFRTPLTVILSSSGLLQKYGDRMTDEKKHHHLDTIYTEVRRLERMLDEVLTLSRAEAVGLAFDPKGLDLKAFCEVLTAEIQQTTEKHRIAFTFRGAPDLVPLDANLIREMIVNLLSNAVKYSPDGGALYFDVTSADGEVSIQVRDEGIGIPPEDQQRLFETFHRATNVGKISGTGLGLAIVRRAVEAHGGQIRVASEVNVGTTFTINLPIKTATGEEP